MDKLWYNSAAKKWKQALPLGNGSLGVMVFGGKKTETLGINDGTLWSGYPKNQNNPESLKYLDEARKLIFEGKQHEAQRLIEEKLTGGYSESYLPLGQLNIKIGGKGSYRRELDLSRAIHTVTVGSVKREAFVSYPDKIAVYRITSDEPRTVTVSAESKLHAECVYTDSALTLLGNAPDCVIPNYVFGAKNPITYDEGRGMCFCLRTEIETDGKTAVTKKGLKVFGAKSITLYSATATGFKDFALMPETDVKYAAARCAEALRSAGRNYDNLLQRHVADYSALYGVQSFKLFDESTLPTDLLLKEGQKDKVSNALINLFYNYGKYLTIAGSRRGGQAMTLQGLWNDNTRPPWSSNYTVNINTQMNYWGASQVGLFECVEPLVDLLSEIVQTGRQTARTNYGCEGFCCNHNVDIWRKTSPVMGNSSYMLAPLCGVWLVNEVCEHLRYGGLDGMSDRIVGILDEAARFVCGYLVERDGYLVTCPSTSPENEYVYKGKKCAVDYATAFDLGLVRQLFLNCIEFSKNGELVLEVKKKLERLQPFTCSEYGINEWHTDFAAADKGHRHFSPLYAFYPARAIGYNDELCSEIEKLFRVRLTNSNKHIGWSAAWSICLAARLRDGKTAKQIIDQMLKTSVFMNLFDVHPPFLFQIDGNFGFVAGVNEMLVSVENGVTELLPACPFDWPDGEVVGMRTAEGVTLSFKWSKGKIVEIKADKKVNVYCNAVADDVCLSDNIAFIKNERR